MPTIDSSLVPLITPGNVLPSLEDDDTLKVRWLEAKDPHYFDVYNRPMADIVMRQLIIAKSLDQLGLRLSGQSNFPFLISCTVDVATSIISLPLSWIWDMHVSISDSWENLRLAVIQRSTGDNDVTGDDVEGTMRLVFTANQVGSTSEVGIFYVDYTIDSNLTYQIRTIKPATLSEFSNPLPTNQHELINGFVVFRTLDIDDNASFFNALTPPVTDVTGTGSSTYTDYEITDTPAGGSSVSSDFSLSAMSHGTGLLVPGAYNVIPPVGVDELSVLSAINYPWRVGTNLKSTDNLSTIPSKLFSQFMLTAPMGDRDSTVKEENFPVYLSKIRRLDSGATSLQLFFSTENTIIGSTSDATIEFATMTLSRGDIGTNGPGTLIEIEPYNNLRDNTDASAALFSQNFGSGFVILSSEWATNTDIDSFFASFESIVDEPADRTFEAQLNEFALHRTPLNIPTIGEAQALAGSTSRRSSPIHPSNDNRYVVESDQGLGDKINFNEDSSITPNDDINPIAYKGSLIRKSVILLVNTANTANFDYDNDILPRLKILFGRNLVHGDEWWDGTTFKRYDQISDTWIG